MEHCPGVDLFDRIVNNQSKQTMSESKAAVIMRSLFRAINHLHANNIAHRDLKPENIMYQETEESDGTSFQHIKIIDFGLSKQVANLKSH